MKITNIKQQVKRQDRYSVYVDEKYECSFSEPELLGLNLRVGQELDDAELAKLKRNSLIDKGYYKTLNLISRRARSEWELRDYLRRGGYDQESQDIILNKLSDLGYVDDLDFARKWIRNRKLLKPTSKRRLIQELRQKRVAGDVIEQALESDEPDETKALEELVERKRKQPKYREELKLMQYLSRQGFNYEDIKQAVRRSPER